MFRHGVNENLVMFPLHYIAHARGCKERRLGANYSRYYFRSNPTYMTTLSQHYRQTDRQTDNDTEAVQRSALGASRAGSQPHFWGPRDFMEKRTSMEAAAYVTIHTVKR